MQIWANSYCRSTIAFYEALANALNLPLRICLAKGGLGDRGTIGFEEDEFAHLEIVDVSAGDAVALRALNERRDWLQIFGIYQKIPHIQRAIREAYRLGCTVGIASEAPCNMDPPSISRIVKNLYHWNILRPRLSDLISGAKFIINWSGDDANALIRVGWQSHKIIPCGYFSPPLLRSKFVQRSTGSLLPFHILCTGSMTWHRGPDILMQALILLKSWGLLARATFTGTGVLEEGLRRMATKHELLCDFPGLVSMTDLISLYQSCTLFVAPGRAEPWGMRVNDALNCGAPSIVSRGMGASKLILDYGCGSTFAATDPVDLAWKILRYASEPDYYQLACNNLSLRHGEISPGAAALRVAGVLQRNFSDCLIEPTW